MTLEVDPPGARTALAHLALVAACILAAISVLAGCVPVGSSTVSAGPTGPASTPSLTAVPTEASTDGPAEPAPPVVELRSRDGVTDGVVGSWTLNGFAVDAPWLPATSLTTVHVAGGETLAVSFADGTRIATWVAHLAPAADVAGSEAQPIARGDAPGARAISIGSLPGGDWVLAVTLARADERGEATAYWAISVR